MYETTQRARKIRMIYQTFTSIVFRIDPGVGPLLPSFGSHPGAFDQLFCPQPQKFVPAFEKMLMSGGLPGKGRGGMGATGNDWCITPQIYRRASQGISSVRRVIS